MIASLYEVDVVHVRAEPVRHEVRRRGYSIDARRTACSNPTAKACANIDDPP